MATLTLELRELLVRQIAFSQNAFGPGTRRGGVCDHIRKELEEVLELPDGPDTAKEWVDVVLLALDGLTRSLFVSGRLNENECGYLAAVMIEEKQKINIERKWPDWRTKSQDEAIEHIKK